MCNSVNAHKLMPGSKKEKKRKANAFSQMKIAHLKRNHNYFQVQCEQK